MFKACFVITEECNMSCEYCYMNNTKQLMSRDTFDFHHENTLPYFMKHYNETEYALDIFGGEPLTYWPMVTHIINKTKDDSNRGSINLMTNGLLLNEKRVDYLQQNNVNMSLSFDGLWAQQLNKYRALRPLLRKAFEKCSVCITPTNMDMAENFTFLVDEFDLIPKFKIVKDNIWTKEDVENFKYSLDQLEEVFIEYFNMGRFVFPSIFEHRLLMMLESSAHQMSKMRCFVGLSGAAFGSNNKVYPCARFLTSDYYPIHDGVDVIKDNLYVIDSAASLFNDECHKCELGDHCDHICLHQEMLNNGILSNVCELYKAVETKVLDINDRMRENKEWRMYLQEQTRRATDG